MLYPLVDEINSNPVVLRVEGDNSAGLGHRLTQKWATEGLSLQGLMMSVIGEKFVGYVCFDSVAERRSGVRCRRPSMRSRAA